jgi:hypothetical protein
VIGKRGRKRKQLLGNLQEKRGYWKLKEGYGVDVYIAHECSPEVAASIPKL